MTSLVFHPAAVRFSSFPQFGIGYVRSNFSYGLQSIPGRNNSGYHLKLNPRSDVKESKFYTYTTCKNVHICRWATVLFNILILCHIDMSGNYFVFQNTVYRDTDYKEKTVPQDQTNY